MCFSFFGGGGNFGPPLLTLKPSKKNKTKKPKTNKRKNTYHIKKQGNPKQQEQKPEHSNLIFPTTTTRKTKQKTQKFKTNKRKGQHKKIRVLKANAKKTLKSCRKIVFVLKHHQ